MGEYLNCIEMTFHQSPQNLRPLNKGLTNQNFLFEINSVSYVLRIPHPNGKNIVNRLHEAAVISIIQNFDLDVPVLYFDPLTGIKITQFKEQLYEYNQYSSLDKIERVAILMLKLHQIECKCQFRFDPIERLSQYKNCIENPHYDLSYYESILGYIATISNGCTLCHNDWVSGNILFSEQKDYLIDYEYASDNNPLFDVMSFITENKIEDEATRNRFYRAYFKRDITSSEFLDCTYFECFHNLLWCYWAMMMLESRNEPIYKKIMEDKYIALVGSYDRLIELEYSCQSNMRML